MSAISKRTALVGWLESQTALVRSGLKTSERFRSELITLSSIRTVRNLMGDPIFYADALLRGSTQDATQDRHTARIHSYDVRLWYEYEDADTYANSSQSTFDDLCYGSDGIIPALLNDGTVDGGGETAKMPLDQQRGGVNDEVRIDVLADQPLLLAHVLTFTVQLT